jgi:protein-S-isoprenylcysteine O-methyltransferase Ste14
MSLTPEFELGIWNAWILVLPMILSMIMVQSIFMKKRDGGFKDESMIMNEKEKKIEKIHTIVTFALIIYPLFLPLQLDTTWFYIGFIIYLVCMIFSLLGVYNFATTPKDKPVTKGIYRISRHPMYFFGFLTFIGIGITAASWLYLILAAAYIVFGNIVYKAEERVCLNKYGDTYREYMNRTPRWIGIPKSQETE